MASSILQEINSKTKANIDNLAGSEAELTSLPEDFKVELYKFFVKSNELLRHFWASYPLTTPKAYDKASRIHEALSHHYDDINKYKNSLPPERRNLGPLLLTIIHSLDKAIEKYLATKKP